MTRLKLRKAAPTLGCTALLMWAACRAPNAPQVAESEYRFIHRETTGLTRSVRLRGAPADAKEVSIQFSPDSDPEAVRTLEALNFRVSEYNADASRAHDGLVIVGALGSEVLMTPDGPDRATPERYRLFQLHRWFLTAPFVRRINEPVPASDETPQLQHDTRLHAEDFDASVDGDLGRFVR